MEIEMIRHKLAELRKGMEQLRQQALMQQGAIAVLEQLLEEAEREPGGEEKPQGG